MSLRTIQRVAIMSALAYSAVGCGDSEKKPSGEKEKDAGSDASSPGDGDGDGDAGAPKPVMCPNAQGKDELCEPTMSAIGPLAACCDPDANNSCGAMLNQGGFNGCFSKSLLGSASTHCSDFWDSVDGKDDNGLTSEVEFGGSKLSVLIPGCCTQEGLCGVALNNFNVEGVTYDVGIDCVPLTRLAGASGGAASDAGMPSEGDAGAPSAPLAPFCVPSAPDKAACPLFTNDAFCESMKAIYPDCDPTKPAPDWVCVMQQLPRVDTGVVPTITALDGVPEYIRGCGANDDGKCIPGLPDTLWGNRETAIGSRMIGDKTVECLEGLPEYAKGCGETGEPSQTNPCIRHAKEVNGCINVPAGAPPVAGVPEFVCGCGDTASPAPGVCLDFTDPSVCGAIEVKDDATLAAINPTLSNALCGCIDHPDPNPALCLKNVEYSVCGSKAVCAPVNSVGAADVDGDCQDGYTCKDTNTDGTGDRCDAPT